MSLCVVVSIVFLCLASFDLEISKYNVVSFNKTSIYQVGII